MRSAPAALALLLLAAGARPAAARQSQDPSWVEVRFHRVYLTNGNFIDGQLMKNTPQGATLQMKSGEMTIRADMIDRIEYIKVRSLQEAPVKVAGGTPKKAAPAPSKGEKPAPEPPKVGLPLEAAGADPETVAKVDAILARMRKAPIEKRGEIAGEFSALGVKAALYLGANIEALDDDILTFVGPLLRQFKSPQVLEILVQMTRCSKPSVRSEGASSLGLSGDPAMSRPLLPLLKDSDVIVRGIAVEALGSLNATDAITAVSKVCIDPDRAVRARAFTSLQKLSKASGQPGDLRRILADLVSEAQGPARAEVLMNLSRECQKEDWPLVARYLNDDDGSVRQAAAFGLGNLAAPDSAESIVARLDAEKDKWTRMYLSGAVLKLRAYRGVDALISWLSDDDTDIRTAAYQALRGLTSQSLEPKRELWETYWASARARTLKE
jgi:HEAT repeat protein